MNAFRWALVVSGLWATVVSAQLPSFLEDGGMQPLVLQPSTSLASPTVSESVVAVEDSARIVDERVFGSNLFLGRFASQTLRSFNPEYVLGAGDWVDLKLWGAVEAVLRIQVDSQGNLFVPKIGPIAVAGVRNGDLRGLVESRVKAVYRDNVGVYASLATAEPVKVFVTGNVVQPGLYGAYSSDSILHFLDRAGGIDTRSGSFLDVRVVRQGTVVRSVNLYDFLLDGQLPLIQFSDGDTVVVGPKKSTATVKGLVKRPLQFEFDQKLSLVKLLEMAGVDQSATHVQIVQNRDGAQTADYLPLHDLSLASIEVFSGDLVSVFADRKSEVVIATVTGEFEGLSQYVLPHSASLDDLLNKVRPSALSNWDGVQLFRESVSDRQKKVLDEMLQKLERSVLSVRSSTREEAELRTREAELVLKFIERARKVKPDGHVVLPAGVDASTVFLEDNDIVHIPRKSNTIAVQGEVFFPSAFAWQPEKDVAYYLGQAGGMTQRGDQSKVFVRRPNGEMVTAKFGWFGATVVQPGDEILVMPQVDTKEFQFSKDLVQIIYQLALSAGVVLAL